MIIKGLFRRYERWNPVHPTSGAFWGMGIGFGCGVGWGPGFGPEVIGYVGAGCGVGFSVGITLAGFGIGLPANYVFEVPYNALMATRSGALDIARSSGLLGLRNVSASGWSNIAPHITEVQTKVLERFSSSKHKDSCNEMVDLSAMRSIMSTHTRSILDNLRNFGARFSDRHKGLKD
ncbi:cadmium-induced protein AS8 isoform X2 [Actinidia eriantha]|nr:cadmium-induced protein AS8 isoform X2 [Actinidia eriantha]XP_057478760.1 cadmium-induced protein AS8 isoform X2 [Actinidia eriantha]